MWPHVFTANLINHDRVHRHYAYLMAIIVVLTVLFMLLKPITTPPLNSIAIPPLTWGSPLCTAWTALLLVVVTLQVKAESEKRLLLSETLKLASQALLMLVVLIFYEGSNVVQRHRYALFGDKMLYDSHLLRLDEAVLGWLCPQGQLALCLDVHPLIGVKTLIGAVVAEVHSARHSTSGSAQPTCPPSCSSSLTPLLLCSVCGVGSHRAAVRCCS